MASRASLLLGSLLLTAACSSTTVATSVDAAGADRIEESPLTPDVGLDTLVTPPDAPGLDVVTPPDAPGLDVVTPPDLSRDLAVVDRDDPGARCGANGEACCPDRTPVCDAGLICERGTCTPCPEGRSVCGGTCANLASDPSNCGACGRSCAPLRCCSAGVCGPACSPSFGDCDGECGNGCETNLASDLRNCGGCGRVCTAPTGSTARCTAGACIVSTCGPTDCDMNVANGLETDVRTDACNCGACGHRCESLRGVASATCEACACRLTCHSSFGDCDRDPSNGCEVPLSVDVRHCGACGRACAAGQGCRSGVCVDVPSYTTCPARMANLRNDVEHCGACGRACAAGQVCDRGTCAASCEGASMRCGPETCLELGSNPLHCGMCGSQCASGRACSFGRCLLGCSAGTTVCAGICTDLRTDSRNCGSCGETCPLSAVCSDGVCQSRTCR